MFLQKKKENGPKDTDYIYKDANSSKARENTQTVDYRQRFNDTYSTIIGGMDKTTGNTGYSQDNNGNVSNVLKYDSYYNDEYKSELVQNTKYSVESANNYVNIYGSTGVGVSIISTTKNAECNLKDMYEQLPEGTRAIENVNLGLYQREQPDLAIVTDIDNIKLSINGYEHTYNYRQRANYVSEGIPDKDLNAGYDATMDGFRVFIKNSKTDKYKQLSYNRGVYDSYIAYTKNDSQNENRLRMFVTYRIAVKNESGGLISKVSLRNYADARYESISDSYVYDKNKSDGRGIDVNWNPKPLDAKTNIWETGIIDKEIAPGECMYVYLQYEVSTATIVEMATLNPNGKEGNNKEPNIKIETNVTEINAYQTYKKLEDGQNHTYAGIDKDSAPNNIIYDNTATYEDDTDAAPDLYLTRKASKQFSGLVFEDATDNQLKTESERLGNGVYDENEDPAVKNVEVKLVKYNSNSGLVTNNDDVITLYNLDADGNVVPTQAQTITADGGTYNFTGFIPGEYYIVYTYGKYKYIDMNKENTSSDVQSEAQRKVQGKVQGKAITTQEYKSTIIDEGTYRTLIDNNYNIIKDNNLWYWYENSSNFEKSSAVDDENIRTNINNYLSVITYGNKTAYEGESYNDNNGNNVTNANHQLMKSYTGIMDVAIEDSRDQTTEYEKSGVSDEEKRNYQIKYGYDTNSGGNGETSDEVKRNYQIRFGIVERPRQSLKVTKDIASVKLALANGQIIAEGTKEDIQARKVKYIVYPDGGPLKIEIDNEIIEGADLDINYRINVQNLSEIDYNDLDYYRYGFVKDKNKESSLVKLTPAIADYVDEKLSVTYDIGKDGSEFKYYDTENDANDIWQLLQTSGKKDNKLAGINISDSVFGHIKNRSNIVVNKTADEILPKVTKDTVNYKNYYLLAKKKLTSISTNSDNTFENYVELIEVSNSVGRFYGVQDGNNWKYETPGNFDVTNRANLEESDTNSNTNPSKVTIMPPTGDNKIYYYIIGISSLVILVGGIIIIKKKVL